MLWCKLWNISSFTILTGRLIWGCFARISKPLLRELIFDNLRTRVKRTRFLTLCRSWTLGEHTIAFLNKKCWQNFNVTSSGCFAMKTAMNEYNFYYNIKNRNGLGCCNNTENLLSLNETVWQTQFSSLVLMCFLLQPDVEVKQIMLRAPDYHWVLCKTPKN